MVNRRPRLSIEVLPDEKTLIRQARAAAALQGQPLRAWVMAAIRAQLQTIQVPPSAAAAASMPAASEA